MDGEILSGGLLFPLDVSLSNTLLSAATDQMCINSTGLIRFETRVHIAYALLTVTYLATALSILLSCQPMHKFWQINPDPGSKLFSFSYNTRRMLLLRCPQISVNPRFQEYMFLLSWFLTSSPTFISCPSPCQYVRFSLTTNDHIVSDLIL